ncbi:MULTISPECIES: hypothetical protein [Spirosoma]|uniref:Uncharacterized protein n=1 Tax=Spirosoma sordidisoli TaxID=2502893 RepID=A0A4Q2UJZ3_9BACT|nr:MULTISPECIES: hypothetical protein [Spirosoma]RYC69827.1 hypothetical protein EQG79_14635 [Spirosoma sordidisoli]
MIAITNDQGEALQLDPGQEVITEQAVAWLSDDELPAEFSYPIQAPLNDHNRRFVRFGYRPDAARPLGELAVRVEMQGVLYRRCRFGYRLQGGKLTGFLKLDSAEFYDRIRNLTLLEALPDRINLGDGLISGQTIPIATRLRQIAEMPPGQFPLTFFPIRNDGFFESALDAVKVPGFVRQPYVNAWEALTGGGYGFRTDTLKSGQLALTRGYPVVPFFYLSWVLERIMALAGFRLESDWLASPEAQRLVIVNMTALPIWTGGQLLTGGINTLLVGHTVTAGQHMPDMSVSDFLKAIKGRFGLAFTFNANDRICRLVRFVDSVAQPPLLDLTPYQSGPYDCTDPFGKGYRVIDYVDSADSLYKTEKGELLQPAPLTIGDGQQLLNLRVGTTQLSYEASTLAPKNSPASAAGRWFVPIVRQPGNLLDEAYKASEHYLDETGKIRNPVGLKLLSYRGMTQDSTGRPHPLGTPDVRDGRQQIVGTDACMLSGRYGLWRRALRNYVYFRNQTRPITQKLLLPVSVLSALPLHGTVSLSLDDHIRRSYLISKVQAESPGPDGLAIVKLEVLSLPSGLDLPGEFDDPVVWVDIVLGPKVAQPLPVPSPASGTYPVWKQSVTVRCWSDSGRTQPFIPSGLPVNLRQRMPGMAGVLEGEEYVTTYVVNTHQTIVTTDFVATQNVYGPDRRISIFERTIQLDPGDGYTLL